MKTSVIDSLNEKSWQIRTKDLKECLKMSKETLAASEQENYLKGIAEAKRNLGYCYWRMSDYDKSLSYTLDAIDLFKKINDKKGLADALNNLGAVYMFQKKHQKRLETNLECLSIRKEINDHEGIASSMNNIGETYMEMGDYESAEKWFWNCIEYKPSSFSASAWSYFNLGKIKFYQKKSEESLGFLEKAIEMASAISYDSLLTEIYLFRANYYLESGNLIKCIESAEKSIFYANKIDSKENLSSAYKLLSDVYEKKGEFQQALYYFRMYDNTKEKYLNEQNIKLIENLEIQYEIANIKRKEEIQKLRNQELLNSFQKIEFEYKELTELFNELRENLMFARIIQNLLIDISPDFKIYFPQHFLFYQPKIFVSGDFIWTYFDKENNNALLVVADCTGHGVAASLISVICISFLENHIRYNPFITPQELSHSLHSYLKHITNNQEYNSQISLESLIVKIYPDTNSCELFSTGIHSNFINRQNESTIFKEFNQTIKFNFEKGDHFYAFSDGIYDQFGGDKKK